jgi:RNA polymerase sigma-70 factor (ECF subfamily)
LNNLSTFTIQSLEREARVTDCHEQTLFDEARAGNRAAFDRLQQRLQAPMRRFLWRLIGRSAEEEDILRDAFLALYMNLERLRSAESLRPFLFRVLRNLSYSELRRQGRFATVSLDTGGKAGGPAFPEIPDPRLSPHEQAQWLLLYGEVQKAMERLPELQRQTLILYFEEDLTYQQIAETMATDIGTVKSRIHYARQNLVRHLRPDVAEALGIHKEKPHGNL